MEKLTTGQSAEYKWLISIWSEMEYLYITTFSQSSETISEEGWKDSKSQRARKTRVEMLIH